MGSNPVNPTPPPGSSPPGPGGPQKGKDAVHYQKGGQIHAKPFKWGSMYFDSSDAQKLWNALIQQINTQIKHDQDKAIKALKKLKKSSTGEGGDDDE